MRTSPIATEPRVSRMARPDQPCPATSAWWPPCAFERSIELRPSDIRRTMRYFGEAHEAGLLPDGVLRVFLASMLEMALESALEDTFAQLMEAICGKLLEQSDLGASVR